MIQYKTASTSEELHQILALQKANLPISISSEEKNREGFLTVRHEFDILNRMNDVCPHIIAVDKNVLAGYALCMDIKFGKEVKVLRPMFIELENNKMPFNTFIIMGQVCVAKKYRNQGVFRKLYSRMKACTFPEFDAIVTEVDVTNKRSLEAHYAIGFNTLSRYHSNDQDWDIIYLM